MPLPKDIIPFQPPPLEKGITIGPAENPPGGDIDTNLPKQIIPVPGGTNPSKIPSNPLDQEPTESNQSQPSSDAQVSTNPPVNPSTDWTNQQENPLDNSNNDSVWAETVQYMLWWASAIDTLTGTLFEFMVRTSFTPYFDANVLYDYLNNSDNYSVFDSRDEADNLPQGVTGSTFTFPDWNGNALTETPLDNPVRNYRVVSWQRLTPQQAANLSSAIESNRGDGLTVVWNPVNIIDLT